ncbi:amidohydrolase [Sphingorhabdus contaminans]|uniref:amidohydrolase n=1 Tax=Sphingorhabdus contaminans TaxID=1343899 RepID=UPI003D2E8BC6
MHKQILSTIAGGLALVAASASAHKPAEPGSLWRGGTIITMDGERPQTVEAVVERGGRIVFAGRETRARRIAGRAAADRDLNGATMLPGFVDAHSHFAIALQLAGGIDLSDPAVGTPRDISALLTTVQREVTARAIPEDQWVVVWQYNEEALAERRHVTRVELDAVLPKHKVVLVHVSVHGVVANSATLAAAKLDENSPVPDGGVMTKGPDGKLTGLLFEKAMFPVMMGLPQPSEAQKLAALEAAQLRYAREGFTHAQDGSTQPADVAFLTGPAAAQRMKIDLALLPSWMGLDALLARSDVRFGSYQGRVKLQGIKFLLDGSPQARTAYMTRDYARGAPDGSHPWHGQPVTPEAEFLASARKVHARGWQIFVHANGDAAIDMAVRSFDALGIKAKNNRRPVVIHSQFQRPDQLAAYARIGVGPAYFSNHTHYFADTHRSNFSPEVVGFISPFKAARAAGLRPSNHSDFPVTALDPFTQLWSSMARTSLTGVVSGEDQRLSAYEGLQALTTGAAWQVYEENRKGRIRKGMLADFVVLDRNPLTTPLDQIRSIKVLETVKEGETVWRR